MRKRATVLVTSVGGVVGEGIIKSLRLANMTEGPVSYRIIAADASPQAAGLYRSDAGFVVPLVSAPGYVDSIIKICRDEGVKAVFVGGDEEVPPLAEARRRIEAESEAITISNPVEVVSVGQDKWKTSEFMRDADLPHAESALPEDQERFVREFGFPLVVKPREGHGSEQFYLAADAEEMRHAMLAIQKRGWRPLLQEYLPADDSEFTTGVTVDKEGRRVMSSISMRRRLKSGQTYKAFIDDFPDIRSSAEKTALRLGGSGPINVQARLVRGEAKVFEINPRFSASCPLRAVAGVNEPDLTFRNFVLGEDVTVEKYRRMTAFRYWNEVYLDYDSYESTCKTGRAEPLGWTPNYF